MLPGHSFLFLPGRFLRGHARPHGLQTHQGKHPMGHDTPPGSGDSALPTHEFRRFRHFRQLQLPLQQVRRPLQFRGFLRHFLHSVPGRLNQGGDGFLDQGLIFPIPLLFFPQIIHNRCRNYGFKPVLPIVDIFLIIHNFLLITFKNPYFIRLPGLCITCGQF